MNPSIRGRRFFIRTFGCQMNVHDSERLAGSLAAAGARPAGSAEEADIIIVNTCAVREKPEEKLDSYLGRLAPLKRGKDVVIGVAGCVAQLRKDRLLVRKPFLDFVVGPDNYPEIPSIAAAAAGSRLRRTGRRREWCEGDGTASLRESRSSGFVTVMEGCDNFCTYCVVPFSRGREKSRPRSSVLREVRGLAGAGYKEVQLLGQNVNSYRDPETGRGLAGLLEDVCAVPGLSWVRFITSHPRSFGPEIIRAMASNRKVCRQLHLPLQSGSTDVLGRMNRGYSRTEYLQLVRALRAALPGLLLSTDIIVGFPGETERDFADTCRVLEEVRFANIFSFRYSPRPLTAAGRMADDVPRDVKRRRLVELQNLQKGIQLEVNRSFIGRDLTVLCTGAGPKHDGRLSGRTEGGQVVNFSSPRDLTGEFVTVRILDCGPYSLHGEPAVD